MFVVDCFAGGTNKRRMVTDNYTLIHRPSSHIKTTAITQTHVTATPTTSPTKVNNHQSFTAPKTPAKLFYKTNSHKKSENRITVNSRPFSASSLIDSPYAAKHSGKPRRGSARTRRSTPGI